MELGLRVLRGPGSLVLVRTAVSWRKPCAVVAAEAVVYLRVVAGAMVVAVVVVTVVVKSLGIQSGRQQRAGRGWGFAKCSGERGKGGWGWGKEGEGRLLGGSAGCGVCQKEGSPHPLPYRPRSEAGLCPGGSPLCPTHGLTKIHEFDVLLLRPLHQDGFLLGSSDLLQQGRLDVRRRVGRGCSRPGGEKRRMRVRM